MKKALKFVFLTLLTFILCSVLTSETKTASNPKAKIPVTTEYRGIQVYVSHSGSPNVRCYKCKYCTEVSCKGYSYCLGCPAWRRYDIQIIKEGDARYATYRCQHGHELLVSLTTEDIK